MLMPVKLTNEITSHSNFLRFQQLNTPLPINSFFAAKKASKGYFPVLENALTANDNTARKRIIVLPDSVNYIIASVNETINLFNTGVIDSVLYILTDRYSNEFSNNISNINSNAISSKYVISNNTFISHKENRVNLIYYLLTIDPGMLNIF
jgi:hypothetical protein